MLNKFIFLFFERGIVLFLGLFSSVLLARSLSVVDYGLIQGNLSIVFFLASFLLFAPAQVVQRQLIVARHRFLSVIDSAFALRFYSCLFCLVSLFALFLFGFISFEFFLVSFILLNEPFSLCYLRDYHQGNTFRASVARASASVVRLCWLFVCWWFELSIYFVCLVWILEMLVQAALGFGLSFFINFPYISIFNCVFEKRLMRLILARSLVILPYLVAATLLGRLDRLVLPFFFDSDIFGSYAVAASMMDQVLLAISLGVQLLIPTTHERFVFSTLSRTTKFFLFLSLAGYFVFVYLISGYLPILMNFLVGAKYSAAASFFSILLWCVPFFAIDSYLSIYLIRRAKYLMLFVKIIFSLFFSLLFFYLFQGYGPSILMPLVAISHVVFWLVSDRWLHS